MVTEPKTLRTVVDDLITRRLLSPQALTQMTEALAEPTQNNSQTWLINLLIGISAWLAIIPFLVFLFLLAIIDTEQSAMVVGLILLSGTVLLHYIQKEGLKESLFIKQLSLALNLTGQLLFIGGLGVDQGIATTALVTIVLEIILFAVYSDSILRFLAVLIISTAILIYLYDLHFHQGLQIWIQVLQIWILVVAVGATWCWLGESQHQYHELMVSWYQPLGYGCVVSLFGLLLPSILPEMIEIPSITWWLSTLSLTILLLVLALYILQINHIAWTSPTSLLLLGGTLLVGLLLHLSPGIIAAVIVMTLGFQRSNRLLMGLALIFFTIFLVAYYYHLQITLLMKSVTLISSGLVLLGLRWTFKQLAEQRA